MKCEMCDKDFESKRSDAKTCSPACQKRLQRQNKLREEAMSNPPEIKAVVRDLPPVEVVEDKVPKVNSVVNFNGETISPIWEADGLPDFKRLGKCPDKMQYSYCINPDCRYSYQQAGK